MKTERTDSASAFLQLDFGVSFTLKGWNATCRSSNLYGTEHSLLLEFSMSGTKQGSLSSIERFQSRFCLVHHWLIR